MRILKESIIVAFAFVGVVVGAGFATGQEIFQFFTSHGAYSISGIIVTGLLITLGGMIVMHTGHHLSLEIILIQLTISYIPLLQEVLILF